jgi:hypothetical protein
MFLKNTEELRQYLKFNNDRADDPFWYGENQVFQLVFLAGEEGPSQHQLEAYMDFQEEHLIYMDHIRAKVIDAWEREKGEAPSRFYSDVPMVDVITVNAEEEESDLDIVLSFRTFKFLFYSRWTSYVARFRGRELIYLQTARLFEKEMLEKEADSE